MDIWPQRVRFKTLLDQHKELHAVPSRQVAEALGIKPPTLSQYLYNPKVRPSSDVLQRAAALFGCSILEFIEDPAASRRTESLPDPLDQSRFFANLILKGLKAEDLTDDDRRILFEDFERGLERLRALKSHAARSVQTPGGTDPA